MESFLLLLLVITSTIECGTEISWNLLTRPVYFGNDVLMSCYRPYFKGGMYLAWTDKTENYIGRGNISSNNIKYEVKLDYTKTGINYTLTIKSFDSDDVNTTYRCYMGFESFLANLVEMNTTFLYLPRSGDISYVNRAEKHNMIQVVIWKAYPKPVCHIFVRNSRIEDSYNSTYERVSVFYKVTLSFSYDILSKYCDKILLITCDIGTTAFNLTHDIPIHCEETKDLTHSTLALMLCLILGITVLLTLILLFAFKRKGVLCWRGGEHNPGNDKESTSNGTVQRVNSGLLTVDDHNPGHDEESSINETVHANNSLLNNPD